MTNKLCLKPFLSPWCGGRTTQLNAAVEQSMKGRGQSNIFKWCKGLSTNCLTFTALKLGIKPKVCKARLPSRGYAIKIGCQLSNSTWH